MYQYSLAWYVNLFNHALEFAPRSDDLQKRLDNLIEYFTYSLYKNICRSLFEKDKLLFSFTLAATIFTYKGTLDAGEYRFLLTGGLGQKPGADDVPCKWLNKNLWLEMLRLSDLPASTDSPTRSGLTPTRGSTYTTAPTPSPRRSRAVVRQARRFPKAHRASHGSSR